VLRSVFNDLVCLTSIPFVSRLCFRIYRETLSGVFRAPPNISTIRHEILTYRQKMTKKEPTL
ncbi:hypothetical protein AAHB49_17740, partial [Bacillus cereus]